MKTIPLKTLLESITKLPWGVGRFGGLYPTSDGPLIVHASTKTGKCTENWLDNERYISHCCNHFPELVAVAREFQTCVQRDWHVPQELCDRMAKILASAETVQIEE